MSLKLVIFLKCSSWKRNFDFSFNFYNFFIYHHHQISFTLTVITNFWKIYIFYRYLILLKSLKGHHNLFSHLNTYISIKKNIFAMCSATLLFCFFCYYYVAYFLLFIKINMNSMTDTYIYAQKHTHTLIFFMAQYNFWPTEKTVNQICERLRHEPHRNIYKNPIHNLIHLPH